nr:class F sortase [Kineococcus siccus]
MPALEIAAPVLAVGVDEDGLLEIPRDGDDIGWYRWSAVPGGPGTSVFAGHVDTVEDGPGAFFALERAAPGDRVAVTLEDGSVREFAVTARESFPKQALPVDTVFRRGGPPQLVLVTCSGRFDERTRSYEENLVVTAEPVG